MPDGRNKSRRRRQSATACVRGKPTTWMNLPFMRASNPFLQPPSHRLWDLVGYQRHDYATHTHTHKTRILTNIETQRWKEREREGRKECTCAQNEAPRHTWPPLLIARKNRQRQPAALFLAFLPEPGHW